MCNIWHTSNTSSLRFASPLAKQNKSKKHKSVVVGETIVFSICNKPFKPIGIPSGQVKSHKGLLAMTPTNFFLSTMLLTNKDFHTNTWFLLMSRFKKMNTTITSLGLPKINWLFRWKFECSRKCKVILT